MAWIRRHWLAIFGALSSLFGLWPGFKWLLTQLEHVVFIVEAYHWAESVMDDIPPWAGFIVVAIGLVLIWWDSKRDHRAPRVMPDSVMIPIPKSSTILSASKTTAIDSALYNELVAFTLDYLMPACDAKFEFESAAITQICGGNASLGCTTLMGILQSGAPSDYHSNICKLESGLESTAGHIIEFDEMVNCIEIIEQTYYNLGTIRHLMKETGTNLNVGNIVALYLTWRSKHEKMVKQYEKIKRDSRIPKLFRPGKESRWGEIPPLQGIDLTDTLLRTVF